MFREGSIVNYVRCYNEKIKDCKLFMGYIRLGYRRSFVEWWGRILDWRELREENKVKK